MGHFQWRRDEGIAEAADTKLCDPDLRSVLGLPGAVLIATG
jgi:hypothetical protein